MEVQFQITHKLHLWLLFQREVGRADYFSLDKLSPNSESVMEFFSYRHINLDCEVRRQKPPCAFLEPHEFDGPANQR
jgi:hypothetical protein